MCIYNLETGNEIVRKYLIVFKWKGSIQYIYKSSIIFYNI